MSVLFPTLVTLNPAMAYLGTTFSNNNVTLTSETVGIDIPIGVSSMLVGECIISVAFNLLLEIVVYSPSIGEVVGYSQKRGK